MLTGKIKSQVDEIWEAFWTGGITNPISVIEQFTYLLFTRILDDIHTCRECKVRIGWPENDRISAKNA